LVIVSSSKTRLTLSRIVKKVRSQASVLALTELPLTIHLSFERMLCSQAANP
jgi:flagellar biosynthesis component FlhA